MKVLIIGLGSIARKHIAALRRCVSDVEIYALRSGSKSSSYDYVIDIYQWEEAFKVSYDFVIVSNPTSMHRSTVEKLIAINVPLFIEKPLFDSLEGESLIKEIRKKQIPTYVACNLRFLDVLRSLRNKISDRVVNEVNVYCGSYLLDWRPGIDYRTCYSAIPEMGGGVHIDLIHELDYIYWFFGKPDKVHKVFTHKSSLGIRAYDYAHYLLEYKDFNVNVTLNYYRRDSKRICEIVTSTNTLTADLLTGTITDGQGKVIDEYSQRISDTYYDQMYNFLSMLKSGDFNFNTVEDAYNVLKICLES